MFRLAMVLAIVAVGFVSMKSCDSAISLQNQQTKAREEMLEQKVLESEDAARERLDQALDPGQ